MKKPNWKEITQFEGPEESPGFLLWHVSTMWRRQIESALKTVGLTHPQFVLLASLGWLTRKGAVVTQVELARYCKTDITMTSQIVRALELKGYIKRTSSPTDERAKLPQITQEGSKLIAKATPIVEATDDSFFKTIGPEITSLVFLLQKLLH